MYTVSPLTSERRACCLTMSINCPTFPLWTTMNSSLKGRLSHEGLDTSHRWLPWEWTTTRWWTLLKSEQTISTCLSAIIFWLVDWSEINIEIEKMSTLKINKKFKKKLMLFCMSCEEMGIFFWKDPLNCKS